MGSKNRNLTSNRIYPQSKLTGYMSGVGMRPLPRIMGLDGRLKGLKVPLPEFIEHVEPLVCN